MPALINDWRRLFSAPTLPFYSVLLAGYAVGGAGWADVRGAQLSSLSLPYTGVVSAIDGEDPTNIYELHPRNKSVLATRMAALIEADVYGMSTPTRPPTLVSASARYTNGLLSVSLTMDVGDSPPTSSLVLLGTPGCTTCCRPSSNSTRPLFRHFHSVGGRGYYGGFDSWTLAGTKATLTAAVNTTLWAAAASMTLSYAWTDFVECLVYNQAMIPANPWQVSLPLTPTQDSSSGAIPVPPTSSTATPPISSSSSSSSSGGSDVVPPDNNGGNPSSSSSSSSSGALTAMVIVFAIFALLCTLLFAWQYRLRHGSLCCKGGDEGGRVGAQGVSDWWTNTMGVGKSLQWKRGMSDDEVLRAVASDRYD